MFKYWLLLGIFVIFADLPTILCARILCVFQMPAVSHQATFQPISRALSLRGHEVIAVTPHPINDSSLTNLTEIDTNRETYKIIHRHGFEFFMSKELTVQSKIKRIFSMYNEFADVILGNDKFKSIYKDKNQKFDLIISQIYISPIMFALSNKLKAPVIGVSSMGGWSGTHIAAGNPNPPSIYSEMFLPYNGDLTYGRKDVKQVNGRVHLFLSYSPRNETVEVKVGKLPVRYLRVAADDEEELQLFIHGMQQFSDVNFYLELDETQESKKRIQGAEMDVHKEEERKNRKKIKILENRVIKTSTSSSLLSHPIEIYDDDADEFESQKYHC